MALTREEVYQKILDDYSERKLIHKFKLIKEEDGDNDEAWLWCYFKHDNGSFISGYRIEFTGGPIGYHLHGFDEGRGIPRYDCPIEWFDEVNTRNLEWRKQCGWEPVLQPVAKMKRRKRPAIKGKVK